MSLSASPPPITTYDKTTNIYLLVTFCTDKCGEINLDYYSITVLQLVRSFIKYVIYKMTIFIKGLFDCTSIHPIHMYWGGLAWKTNYN